LISVLAGSKSWVGYQRSDPQLNELPSLKDGVVEIRSKAKPSTNTLSYVHNFNYLYAKDYRVWFDLEQIILNLNSLDKA
jgi:hypothetical protein